MRHRALILLKSALFEVNSASGCRKIPLKFDLKYGGFQKVRKELIISVEALSPTIKLISNANLEMRVL